MNSGQDSCQIEEGGCVKQMKASGWLSFLVSSLLCFPPWHSKALRPWPTPEIPAPSDTAPEVVSFSDFLFYLDLERGESPCLRLSKMGVRMDVCHHPSGEERGARRDVKESLLSKEHSDCKHSRLLHVRGP